MIGSFFVGLAALTTALAHAPYVLTEGEKVTVVFSDALAPDARVKEASWKKMDGIKLVATTANGKTADVKLTMGEACMKATVPAGTVRVDGHVAYGVFTKGDKARFIHFYPRALIGANAAKESKPAVKAVLEVLPTVEAGKVRFTVLQNGKAVPKLELSIITPEEKEGVKATTDDNGMTQAFPAKGRYGVTVRVNEAKSGEAGGEKYEEIMHVATLVLDLK